MVQPPQRTSDRPKARPAVDQLENASAQLDVLIRDMRLGVRSAPHFDTLEERAQAIAQALMTAFRGQRPPFGAPLHMEIVPGGKSSVWY